MRLRNLSRIKIDKNIWLALARLFNLELQLKGALKDDLEIYIGKTLRITVRPTKIAREDEFEYMTGSYTYGHISLYPCTKCNFASLTQVYLHELFHCWLHQNHPKLYDKVDHCDEAEKVAKKLFKKMGGSSAQICSKYQLSCKGLGEKVQKIDIYPILQLTLKSLRKKNQ